MTRIRIEALCPSPAVSEALSDLLVETVANGGSVGFMHPLAQRTALRRYMKDSVSCWPASFRSTR